MESLKEAVLNCSINTDDDDKFIAALNNIARENGKVTYQVIIQTLTDLDLEPGEAKKCWDEIVAHREKLSNALDRKIRLITAISDYSGAFKTPLNNHKIVEINAYEKVITKVTHDSLTGLFNKAYLRNALIQHLSLAKRHNTDLSILFLDIDDFKEINDTFGHSSGDIILKTVADTISRELRTSDTAARFGGDEFVILMPNTYKMNALLLSERLRKTIEQKTMAIDGKNLQITVSGGVAGFPSDGMKAESLLNLADSALYRAKGAGKNTISLFTDDKRRFLRIKFNREIKVKQLGFNHTRILSGKSKDIAIGGILFENKEPLPIGIKIQVSIPIDKDSEPLLLIGTIVRVEAFGPQQYDIGMILSFKEMEKTAKDEISKFLIQQSKENDK
ncbi:MAG: diguanylate cyclase [Proteobacteria bacterium]|nr:diguanylate cyclase [Pseudomonadota bacterium]MBU1583386.1 diguanylate cyclase [Pseudomonadota bacterium]MBU2453659.1 diguanylate cyclase [Pseudomonadota bacterium]MBU2629247.1 diguanylate cyclase [Pseudomonadota bacterium]